MKLPYTEGTCFTVPLSPSGYALGVVARTSKKGCIFLGYFFGPRHKKIPTIKDVEHLYQKDAIGVWRVGDLGLVDGSWTIIGKVPSWNRTEWSVPQFIRSDPLSHRAWRVTYSDDDMNTIPEEEEIPYGNEGYEPDSVRGCGAVEIVLSEYCRLQLRM